MASRRNEIWLPALGFRRTVPIQDSPVPVRDGNAPVQNQKRSGGESDPSSVNPPERAGGNPQRLCGAPVLARDWLMIPLDSFSVSSPLLFHRICDMGYRNFTGYR